MSKLGGDGDRDTSDYRYSEDDGLWYPRVLSTYALTENVHWSQRMDTDATFPAPGHRPTTLRHRCWSTESDFYGTEDADSAYLRRKPVSFAVFGKPGLLDDQLATALAARWGCVHVSVARGVAAGRADPRTAWALRRGRAVSATSTPGMLVELLGLREPEVKERGYVLSGLPRHDPELSAAEQIDAIFSANPPDVLIYMSCPDRDLYAYRDGLTLKSMEYGQLTQTFYPDRDAIDDDGERVRWYGSPLNRTAVDRDVNAYLKHSMNVVDDTVKRFEPGFVVTVDGRKPVGELLEMVEARLEAMSLHRPVLPTSTLQDQDYDLPESLPKEYEFEEDGDELQPEYENESVAIERNELVQLTSEFGRLCPVNRYRGSFIPGKERYRVRYMGKLYYLAGPEEFRAFNRCPRWFLSVPKPGLPIRAVFYGHRTFSGPAAKAVRDSYGCAVIDVEDIERNLRETDKRTFVSTLVDSALKTARQITRVRGDPSFEIGSLKDALGEWIHLYFDDGTNEHHESYGGEGDGSDYELTEEYPDQSNERINEYSKEKDLMRLRNLFEFYNIDFIEDLNACVSAYNEPLTITKYLQNMPLKSRSIFRSDFLREHKFTSFKLIDMIVDNILTANKENKNWIIINAPLDFLLIKKLTVVALTPIQMIFFHDTDPAHKVLLKGENEHQNKIVQKVIENVKNEMRYGAIKRISYPEFVKKIEKESNMFGDEDYGYFENEMEIENLDENTDQMSHKRLVKMIIPEIIDRLDQYTQDCLKQWFTLKKQISEITDHFMNLSIIECKSNSTTNVIKILIEDTLHHIKKFLSDNAYEVSDTKGHNTKPNIGMYNGDTSIYCPVSFMNGKLSIGSKKYMAIYQNRYYYMSSSKCLRDFISNPNKYTSFTSAPKLYPKPKISVLSSFGLDTTDLMRELSDTFDLTLVDSYKIFERQVLPEFMPMLGKMYEEPTLKKNMEQYFISHIGGHVDSLRRYIDRESAYLNDSDWAKMNAAFFQIDEGTCYNNYPRNLTEFKYLRENEIGPDAIVQVVADAQEEREQAKKAVAAHFSMYQNKLVDNAIVWNKIAYQNTISKRSVMFRNKLARVIRQREMDEVKKRMRRVIETISVETVNGSDRIEETIVGPNESTDNFTRDSSTKLLPRYSRLTLKQKKIIVKYGLKVEDFVGLDDFKTLESIRDTVESELPETMVPIDKFSSHGVSPPSDDMINEYLEEEKNALMDMRKFAESSGVPWIVKSVRDPGSAESGGIGDILALRDGILETSFAVDLETSERYLRTGEFYLSRFGRWCPVRVSEKPYGLVQRFRSDRAKGHVYPVIHRRYVYFLGGPENRDKFVRDPLKYACRPFRPPVHFPLRIAVIGPPGSGGSRSARKLSDRYGLELIRIERAVESYLKTYGWTDESKLAARRLRSGGALSDATLVEAVKSAVQTPLAVAQGFVLDGFPSTEAQFELVDGSGIVLHRVFVANENGPDGERNDGPASLSDRRRRAWTEAFAGREWISKRYGNATGSTDDRSMDDSIARCVEALREYSKNVARNRTCRLADVPVVEREIVSRMSTFSDICSVCKVRDDLMNRPDADEGLRSGLVQYGTHFYWTCPDHRETFAGDPKKYANSAPEKPEILPLTVRRNAWSVERYAKFTGYCAVCALRRLWDPVYRPGRIDFMAEYRRHTFAFCSETCRRRFMSRPKFYRRYGACVGPPVELEARSAMAIDDLPAQGYLEQTVGTAVSSALVRLTAIRPVYPGLSVEISAVLFLGLCVGTNGSSDTDVQEYYREIFERFVETCQRFRMEVFKLKSIS